MKTNHTPGELSVSEAEPTLIMQGQNVFAECGPSFPSTREIANAAELVRRWNTHEELLEACKQAESLLMNITQLSQPNHAVMIGALVKAASESAKQLQAAIAKAAPARIRSKDYDTPEGA